MVMNTQLVPSRTQLTEAALGNERQISNSTSTLTPRCVSEVVDTQSAFPRLPRGQCLSFSSPFFDELQAIFVCENAEQ